MDWTAPNTRAFRALVDHSRPQAMAASHHFVRSIVCRLRVELPRDRAVQAVWGFGATYAVRLNPHGSWPGELEQPLDWLMDRFEAMRSGDPVAASRRSLSVSTRS